MTDVRKISESLFLRAASGARTERTPIWLMRQAGRTDPEYNRVKAECGLPLHDLFRHPELAARISLLPQRFGVDAIIYFQDILTPLAPMGAEFVFSPGPMLVKPIRETSDLARLHTYDVAEELPFIPETFRLVRESLDGALPVLGFAGAPLTLLVFILEEGSFGAHAHKALLFLRDHPDAARRLLDTLTDMTVDYLKLQIQAGADAVQLFESAANLLTAAQYETWALPYQQRIFEALRGSVPTIVFARDWADAAHLQQSGADILSLSERVPIEDVRAAFGAGQVVQGNLDNRLLVNGTKAQIAAAARACVEAGGHRGHIFNLSHGLLRETPFDHVVHLIEVVKSIRLSPA
jgi:uroporphyrinogen decarboxylase